MSKRICVISDFHCGSIDTSDLKYVESVGNFIASLQPDIIVNLGDWWEFDSLSYFDRGTAKFYNTSYWRDIKSGRMMMDRLFEPIYRRKRKLPDRYFFIGNHEYRIERARNSTNQVANMKELLSIDDLRLGDHYNHIIEYDGSTPGIQEIEGILFSHYFKDRVQQHTAHMVLQEQHQSFCSGHHHQLDYKVHVTLQGKELHGLSVPMLKKRAPDWAGNTAKRWMSGLVVLDNVQDGQYDLNVIGEEQFK